jgi:hypothetical protein
MPQGIFAMTVYQEGTKGFRSKKQAEDATIRWVKEKEWIDDNLSESAGP